MKNLVHQHENNLESETHLEKNKKHFSAQCLKVCELLLIGKRLTTMNAPSYGILSLPRRILDLKENGVFFDERWIDKGGTKIKEWSFSPKTTEDKNRLIDFINKHSDFNEEIKTEQINNPEQLRLL